MKQYLLPKTVGFARLLTGILVLVVIAALSLIAVVSSYFTRHSIEDLSDRIVVTSLARIDFRVDSLLRQAMRQNSQTQRLLIRHQLNPGDFEQLGCFFSSSLEQLTDVTYLGLSRQTNGDYLFTERLPDGMIRVREYVIDDSGQRVIRDWHWDDSGRHLLKVAPWDGYDPRKRPFYQAAVAAGTNTWTDTYMFWKGHEQGAMPGITFASHYVDTNGEFAGILNSDFNLDALCNFLAEVQHIIPGYPFIIEERRDGSRRIIAHPDPAMVPRGDEVTNGVPVVRDTIAASFVQYVMSDEQRFTEVEAGKIVTFESGGQKYFGGARKLRGKGMPKWAVVVIIPVTDVMGSVYKNDRRAFWLGLLCLLVIALVAVHLARRIAMPLRQLTHEAQAIGRLELHARSDTPSRIQEVAQLATSMSDMKSSLRSFQKFVPSDVVREIVTSATEARLGGRRANLTIFFSDVTDFTAIAEGTSPEDLVAHVGEYLGEMSEVIHTSHGTVDKFIGDGIMAFWGAPRENPTHATDACRAALQCQRALAKLRQGWHTSGKPELHSRIGLHTGSVIIGNIGSEKRLNYTIIGDSVNLTSRIEGLNKFYGTEILISGPCLAAAGDTVITRPVDSVSVKGRNEAVIIHELLCMADEATDDIRRIAQLTSDAFAAYTRAEFDKAESLYHTLLTTRLTDPVAALMEKRCTEFIATPQPTNWDTTFRMKDK